MLPLHVAAATLNQTPLAWDENAKNLRAALQQARAAGVGLLCLPELCITGYGCEDAFLSLATHREAERVLEELVPETRDLVTCFGLPLLHHGGVYNVCAVAVDGRLVGVVAKQALAGDGIHYEPRWFKAWPRGERAQITLAGTELPIGDLVFDVGGVRIGFEICEDAWIAQRPGGALASVGADVILNPSASHFAFGKYAVRRRLVLEGSRAFGVTYVYSNLLGNEAGRALYDGDAMIATDGALVAEARRFGYGDWQLVRGVVDVELTRARRAGLYSFRPDVSLDPGQVVGVEHRYPPVRAELEATQRAAWEGGPDLKQEELARALGLGLFDYLRKSRSQGFVLSLSGGADSTAIACAVALGLRFAVAELGFERVKERLAHVRALEEVQDERALVQALLTTAYQATDNSGPVTRAAASAVAAALGARHHEIEVGELVKAYVQIAEKALGRPLTWERDDVALQNVQARVRSPGVWLLANLGGALLLSTSNRSEAAVGYATMDGDTSGGLAPIAGIDKAYLRRWLSWLEREGPDGIGPIPELSAVTAQAPTAELRPPSSKQTDEDDLMPYDVLDAIERAAIRDRRGPRDVFAVLRAAYPGEPTASVFGWVERFFQLWSRNQWKRERYAPSFHLDDESLDPKTWCRFPILSGGFRRELAELRAEVLVVP